MFNKLPEELSSTFEKMISQLDVIAKTMKIMDQRIATVENQITGIMTNKKRDKKEIRETGNYNFDNFNNTNNLNNLNLNNNQKTLKTSSIPNYGVNNYYNYENQEKENFRVKKNKFIINNFTFTFYY